ncbi:PH domain-containing protein [Pyxidicoccus trucidator]|uniref:PH domain-containing protein n=1 Tax=Pyxidicoccus trucidator TaxID=2709662 RepID=UPI0013DD2C80|nr:PH domain-containing protein [Pyxidicoccus trucidator]
MGLLDAMLGTASEVDAAKLQEEVGQVLAPTERVEKAFKVVRDLWVFTDKRLILVDKQGLTGSKAEYLSLPYKSITRFSIETAGTFDAEAELRIWVSGGGEPILKQFRKNSNILEVQRVLAACILK